MSMDMRKGMVPSPNVHQQDCNLLIFDSDFSLLFITYFVLFWFFFGSNVS